MDATGIADVVCPELWPLEIGVASSLGLERAEPPNSPGPTIGASAGDIDAGGEGGKGTDAGSCARCDKSHGGLALGEAGICTAVVWLGWAAINQGWVM